MKTANLTMVGIIVLGALSIALHAIGAELPITAMTQGVDGGVDPVTVAQNVRYDLQCANPSCYTVTTDGGQPVCSWTTGGATAGSAYILPLVGAKYERAFDTANGQKLQVKALDAGNPACQLFLQSQNPTRFP